jgi:hypothetical protein
MSRIADPVDLASTATVKNCEGKRLANDLNVGSRVGVRPVSSLSAAL